MFRRITLQNYRCHADSTIDLGERLTLLSGPNQAGKTSFRLGLEALLTSRNELTDGRGSGLKEQIRRGQMAGRVAVTTDAHTMTLDLPGGKPENLPCVVVHRDVIHACLQQGWFLTLPEKEQRRFLSDALQLDAPMTWEEWRAALDAWTPEFPDLGAWMGRETVPGLQRADLYRWAYDERTAVNAVIKRMEAELDAAAPVVATQGDTDLPAMRKLYADYTRRLHELHGQRASAEQTHRAQLEAHACQQRMHDDIARRIAEAQRAVETAANAASAASARIGKGKSSPAKLQAALASAGALLESKVALERTASEAVKAAAEAEGDGRCPEGVCARARMAIALRELRQLSEEAAQAREAFEVAQARVAESDRLSHEADLLSRRSREAEAAVQALLDEQTALEPLPAPPTLLGDEAIDMMIADLEKLRDQVQANLAIAERTAFEREAQQARAQRRADVQRELEALRDRGRRLAALVDAKTGALVESGIVDRRWRTELAAFVAEWNAALREAEIAIDVQSAPWRITLTHRGVTVDLSHASTAERVWATVTLQVTIARRTGFGLVALDELGMLDGLQRRRMYGWLVRQEGVQSIVAAAAQETRTGELVRPPAWGNERVAIYWVEGGAVHPIVPKPAGVA